MSDRRYKVARAYAARVNGHMNVRWPAGSEVELRDDDAAWVDRDAPDLLSEVKPKPAAKKAPAKKGGQGESVAD